MTNTTLLDFFFPFASCCSLVFILFKHVFYRFVYDKKVRPTFLFVLQVARGGTTRTQQVRVHPASSAYQVQGREKTTTLDTSRVG